MDINIPDHAIIYVNNNVILKGIYKDDHYLPPDTYEIKFSRVDKTLEAKFDSNLAGDAKLKINISEYLKLFYNQLNIGSKYIKDDYLKDDYTNITFRGLLGIWIIVEFIQNKKYNNIYRYCYPIRGGLRSQYDRDFVQAKTPSVLTPVDEKIPAWEGYPFALYYLEPWKITKIPLNAIKTNADYRLFLPLIENMPVKGNGGAYIKFYNSRGGYSYWLFENYTQSVATPVSKYTNHLGEVKDFGRITNTTITLKSRVNQRYIELMYDLIDSTHVLLYNKETTAWQTLIPTSNKIETGPYKQYSDVSINLQLIDNYQTSL